MRTSWPPARRSSTRCTRASATWGSSSRAASPKRSIRSSPSNIDLIDCLPPGLYEAVIQEKTPDAANVELVSGDYISRFERRTLADIRALGGNTPGGRALLCGRGPVVGSDPNGLYRTTLQPVIRALATEQSAEGCVARTRCGWATRFSPTATRRCGRWPRAEKMRRTGNRLLATTPSCSGKRTSPTG
jgi:hypothetical protein